MSKWASDQCVGRQWSTGCPLLEQTRHPFSRSSPEPLLTFLASLSYQLLGSNRLPISSRILPLSPLQICGLQTQLNPAHPFTRPQLIFTSIFHSKKKKVINPSTHQYFALEFLCLYLLIYHPNIHVQIYT